jgi:uncharacterized protein
MSQQIEHQTERLRFAIELEGESAVLEYQRISENRVDFKRTFVPERHRDLGIGGRLVRHALEWARENDLKVVPSCSFVKSFADDHPEFKDVVS